MRTLDKLWTTHRGGKCDGFNVLLRLDCNSAQLAQSFPQFPPKDAVLPFLFCVETRQQHGAADERNRRQIVTDSPTFTNHHWSDSPPWLHHRCTIKRSFITPLALTDLCCTIKSSPP